MTVNAMLAGAIAMASAVIGLFFFGFWRNTRDRFFLFFAMSFALEAVNRVLLGLALNASEDAPLNYLIRLAAYALILIAIVDKNRRRKRD